MNRRDLLKLAGATLLSALLPRVEIGEEMELDKIFARLGKNAGLTPNEMDFLKLTARRLQQVASQVGGWTSVMGSGGSKIDSAAINFPKLSGVRVFGQDDVTSGAAGVKLNLGDTIAYDTANYFSAATPTRITVPQKGFYGISANVQFGNASTTGYRDVELYVNGVLTTYLDARGAAPTYPTWIGSYVEQKLSLNDYIEIGVFQNSGSTLGVTADVTVTLLEYDATIE